MKRECVLKGVTAETGDWRDKCGDSRLAHHRCTYQSIMCRNITTCRFPFVFHLTELLKIMESTVLPRALGFEAQELSVFFAIICTIRLP